MHCYSFCCFFSILVPPLCDLPVVLHGGEEEEEEEVVIEEEREEFCLVNLENSFLSSFVLINVVKSKKKQTLTIYMIVKRVS